MKFAATLAPRHRRCGTLALMMLAALGATAGGAGTGGQGGPVADGREPSPAGPKAEGPAARITDLGFLAGTWRGESGGLVEETWTTPEGNNIVGCFRWLRTDGTPRMLEMLAITSEPDGIRLRLRHYSATLGAKEAAEEPMTLKLAAVSLGGAGGATAAFVAERHADSLDRITYRVERDVLWITVAFKAETGAAPRKPLEFRLTRAVLNATPPPKP